MTGVERLRKLAQDYKNVSDAQKYLGINVRREADLLSDIADQIEREWDELRAEVADMRPRLMPEGGWPRYEDGEMVFVGSDFADGLGETHTVTSVEFFDGCVELHWNPDEPGEFEYLHPGERVRRPAPKVLDADGAEIHVGDTVWDVEDGTKYEVCKVVGHAVTMTNGGYYSCSFPRYCPSYLTHRAPVLAADGKPLREGEKPYRVDNGKQVEIRRIDPSNGESCVFVGVDGRSYGYWLRPGQLTHERPDSWKRLWMDMHPADETECVGLNFEEFERRAKALSERGQ